MNNEQTIATGKEIIVSGIEKLYPVDSSFEETAEAGERFLMEAILESDWRDLPVDILALYFMKCARENNRAGGAARNLWG